MIKLLPTKHLLLIAAVSALLAIVLIAIPEEETDGNELISIDASFEIVDQSKLMLHDLQSLSPNTTQPLVNTTQNTSIASNSYDIPAPEALVKKTSAPTFKKQSVEVKPGDSLSKILSNAGISAQDIYKVSQADKKQKSKGELHFLRLNCFNKLIE